MATAEARAIQQLFFIQNKEGKKVPFILNKAQQFFDEHDNPAGRTRIIVAKARQKGFSSIVLAKFATRCLGREGTHAVVISHEAQATQRLLDRAQYCLRHIRGPKPNYGRNSRNEMYFPKMESTYYIGTAGSQTFGRGDWITDLHCSEYAWWEDPVKHAAGLFQAVPWEGRIYIESTGNGRDNDFYYLWEHAEDMGYTRLFYPWFADDEYEIEPKSADGVWRPDLPKYNSYLLELKHRHRLNDRKMAWYEYKLKELREDLRLMQQEYPSNPEECFQATGGSIFPNVNLSVSPTWQLGRLAGWFASYSTEHPKPGLHYVIGADPAGGTGHDDSALVVFCCETFEQCVELFNNTVNPVDFARLLAQVGTMYNQAYIVCEGNNHGAAVLGWLKDNYPRDRLYKSKHATTTSPARFGWFNTQLAKHQLVGLMLDMLDQVTLYGRQTVKELKAFRETPEHKMEGKSDNLVIATGLALLGLKRFEYLKGAHVPKPVVQKEKPQGYMYYTFEEVYDNIMKKHRQDVFGRQAGPGYPMA